MNMKKKVFEEHSLNDIIESAIEELGAGFSKLESTAKEFSKKLINDKDDGKNNDEGNDGGNDKLDMTSWVKTNWMMTNKIMKINQIVKIRMSQITNI